MSLRQQPRLETSAERSVAAFNDSPLVQSLKSRHTPQDVGMYPLDGRGFCEPESIYQKARNEIARRRKQGEEIDNYARIFWELVMKEAERMEAEDARSSACKKVLVKLIDEAKTNMESAIRRPEVQ